MAQIIATAQGESSHYYLPDGTPLHGDLRQARKSKAYPSPTTVLNLLGKPGLDNWKQETAILQSMTLPRIDGEGDAEFAKRVVEASKLELRAAADRGTYVHELAEAAVSGKPPGYLQPDFAPHYASLRVWAENVKKVHQMEAVVVNHDEAYAGRVDLICDWEEKGCDYGAGVEVIDFKTRKFKSLGTFKHAGQATTDDPHKVDSYDGDLIQLAAYAYAVFDEPVRARSVYIDPKSGAIASKIWTPTQVQSAYEVFKHVLAIWRWQKKYDPRAVAV